VFKEVDISCESYREYESLKGDLYLIINPVTLYLKEGSTGHRILDGAGTYHYVPTTIFPTFRWQGDLVY
jgi:hypothetical protein